MVVYSAFKRSLSLPPTQKAAKSCHVRSTSLPCRAHPDLALVKDQMHKITAWIIKKDSTFNNLLSGLRMLKSLYDTMDDFLQLPQTQEVVSHNERWANLLLDDLLKFLEVFGVVGTVLSSLKEHHLSTLISLRRRDSTNMEANAQSFIGHRKKANKEMTKLITVLKSMIKPSAAEISREEVEILAIFNDVKALTVSIAISIVSGLCWTPRRVFGKWVGLPKRRIESIKEIADADSVLDCVLRCRGRLDDETSKMALESMVALEDCLNGLEHGNESIFRGLINTRVSILNILTQ
ncbi:uncharacterized protein LOC116261220 [Nymphaea colorata]|uniref:uncharacterized protein LOC116261220 n=1 Tax=Nymphaea colorata TaxID=210225 RepID=UPI00129E9F65|nr:uncharacterized protein LOC116261220 [Nymphaea colorata]